jgi:hypothetical protein
MALRDFQEFLNRAPVTESNRRAIEQARVNIDSLTGEIARDEKEFGKN